MLSPRTRSTHATNYAAWDGTQITGDDIMTDIARFNTFGGLGRFEPLGREMEDLFKGFFLAPVPFHQISAGRIPIDVTEDDKSYKEVCAELPGFSREEIDVSVNGDLLDKFAGRSWAYACACVSKRFITLVKMETRSGAI